MNKPGAGHHAFHLFSSLPAHSPLSKPTLATKRKRVCCCLSTALHAILTFSHVRPIAPTHIRCFFCILHILPLLCHCPGSSYRCCDSLLGLFDRSPCTVRDLGRTFFESWASIMRATYLFAGLARIIGRQTFSPCLWMNRCNFNNLPSVFISAIRSASGFGSRGSWRSQETTWFGRAKGRYS